MTKTDFSIKKVYIGGVEHNALHTTSIIMYNYHMGDALIMLELLTLPFIEVDGVYYNLTKVVKSSMGRPDAVIYKSTDDNRVLVCLSPAHPEYTHYESLMF